MRINQSALRALRERSGYSQSELADRAAVDRTQLNHLERGRRAGTPQQLRAIAAALNVPLAAIAVFDEVVA